MLDVVRKLGFTANAELVREAKKVVKYNFLCGKVWYRMPASRDLWPCMRWALCLVAGVCVLCSILRCVSAWPCGACIRCVMRCVCARR